MENVPKQRNIKLITAEKRKTIYYQNQIIILQDLSQKIC